MRIVVTTEIDDIYNLEIDSQMAIEDLKALLETEVSFAQLSKGSCTDQST